MSDRCTDDCCAYALAPAERMAAAAIVAAQANRTGRENWKRLADKLADIPPYLYDPDPAATEDA